MAAKIIIVLSILLILYSLFSAFFFMIRDKGEGTRTVQRLSWRVGLSVTLLLAIMAAMAAGWIKPGSSGPIRYPSPVVEEPSDP